MVNQNECFEKLGIIKHIDNQSKFQHCPFYILKRRKMLCSSEEYRKKIVNQGLVKKNNYGMKAIPQGIPQGSPISDVLANIYLIDFDMEMNRIANETGAYYRRYSDDILWICSPEQADLIKKTTKECIEKQGKGTLVIEDTKTTHTNFLKVGSQLCYEGDLFNYLGFSFDGKKALYRDKTISGYKRDVVFSIKSFIRKAHKKRNDKSLKQNLNISQIYHKVGYPNKKYLVKKTGSHNSKSNHKKLKESNFMTYHLRAIHIFNQQQEAQYRLSDEQVRAYKKFIHNKIVETARKYDPSFSL